MQAENKEAIRLLAEVQAELLRSSMDCHKLQFNVYGRCMGCKNSDLCQKINSILNG